MPAVTAAPSRRCHWEPLRYRLPGRTLGMLWDFSRALAELLFVTDRRRPCPCPERGGGRFGAAQGGLRCLPGPAASAGRCRTAAIGSAVSNPACQPGTSPGSAARTRLPLSCPPYPALLSPHPVLLSPHPVSAPRAAGLGSAAQRPLGPAGRSGLPAARAGLPQAAPPSWAAALGPVLPC